MIDVTLGRHAIEHGSHDVYSRSSKALTCLLKLMCAAVVTKGADERAIRQFRDEQRFVRGQDRGDVNDDARVMLPGYFEKPDKALAGDEPIGMKQVKLSRRQDMNSLAPIGNDRLLQRRRAPQHFHKSWLQIDIEHLMQTRRTHVRVNEQHRPGMATAPAEGKL